METPDIIYLSPYKQGEGQDYIGLAWTHPSESCGHVAYIRADKAVTGTIDNTGHPKSLLVENKQWDDLLAQFRTGEKVDIILIKHVDYETN